MIPIRSVYMHRRSQDFVWGFTFLPKSWRPFLVVALTDRLNIPPNLSHSAKTVWLGVHLVSWEGALTHFSCKLGLKNFLTALGVQVHPLHPLATPIFTWRRLRHWNRCCRMCPYSFAVSDGTLFRWSYVWQSMSKHASTFHFIQFTIVSD